MGWHRQHGEGAPGWHTLGPRPLHWRWGNRKGEVLLMKVYLVRMASALTRLVRPTLLAAILAATAAAPAAAASQDQPGCQPDQAAAKYPSLAGKTIKIAADPAIQPYVFRDPANFDHLIGVDADLIPMAMSCVGLNYEYSLGAWGGLLPSVVAGQADMMWANLYYTPERAQQV